jgi:hypothetical protein
LFSRAVIALHLGRNLEPIFLGQGRPARHLQLHVDQAIELVVPSAEGVYALYRHLKLALFLKALAQAEAPPRHLILLHQVVVPPVMVSVPRP